MNELIKEHSTMIISHNFVGSIQFFYLLKKKYSMLFLAAFHFFISLGLVATGGSIDFSNYHLSV
jgi:hypothetical protein